MSKVSKIAAAFAVVPVLAFAVPAFADSPGQLSNGSTNYKVRNVTTNGAYAQSISAVCNDTVKYSVTVANSDYGLLKDVTVKADLASGNISVSAKNTTGDTTSVSGSAKVSVPSGSSLSYVNGSTVVINSANTVTTPLADGVTGAGVNAGNLNGSTYEFVQFQAKLNCAPKTIQVCDLTTNKVVTINENQFDSSKYSKDLTKCQPVTPPSELPHTGAGQTIAMFGVATVVAAAAHRLFSRRQTR